MSINVTVKRQPVVQAVVSETARLQCISVASAEINENGNLVLTLSNGDTVDAGYARGGVGDAGNSVSSANLGADGVLTLIMSDGTSVAVGNVKGPNGDSIELAVNSGVIQWRLPNSSWNDLLTTASLKGDHGDAATITIGSVSTCSPGGNASVTNSGTQNNAVLDFVLPRGMRGEDGDGAGDMLSIVYDPDGGEKQVAFKSDLISHTSDEDIHVTASEKTAWNAKQDALTFDETPTSGSNNPVKSGGIKAELDEKSPVGHTHSQYLDADVYDPDNKSANCFDGSNIDYDNTESGLTATNVNDAIDELFTSASNGKSEIATAITGKGVTTAADATYAQMAANIGSIETGVDTSDADATTSDILYGKTAYVGGSKVTGAIQSNNAYNVAVSDNTVVVHPGYYPTQISKTVGVGKSAAIYTPGVSNQVIDAGHYLTGAQTILGDQNLIAQNIRSGVSIFGVNGTMDSQMSYVFFQSSVVNSNIMSFDLSCAKQVELIKLYMYGSNNTLVSSWFCTHGSNEQPIVSGATYIAATWYYDGNHVRQSRCSLSSDGVLTIYGYDSDLVANTSYAKLEAVAIW